MVNKKVKNYAKKKGVNLWEVAKALGIADTTFSRHLREQLPEESEKEVISIIESIALKKTK